VLTPKCNEKWADFFTQCDSLVLALKYNILTNEKNRRCIDKPVLLLADKSDFLL